MLLLFHAIFYAQDYAERARRYITINVAINLEKSLTLKKGIGRTVELNKTLPYLFYFKHKLDMLEGWTVQNLKFS